MFTSKLDCIFSPCTACQPLPNFQFFQFPSIFGYKLILACKQAFQFFCLLDVELLRSTNWSPAFYWDSDVALYLVFASKICRVIASRRLRTFYKTRRTYHPSWPFMAQFFPWIGHCLDYQARLVKFSILIGVVTNAMDNTTNTIDISASKSSMNGKRLNIQTSNSQTMYRNRALTHSLYSN